MTYKLEEFLFKVHHNLVQLDKPIWIMAYACNMSQYTREPYLHIKPQTAIININEVLSYNSLRKFEYVLKTMDDTIRYAECAYESNPFPCVTSSDIFISFDKNEIVKFYNDMVILRYFDLLKIKLNVEKHIENIKDDLFETDMIMELLARSMEVKK